MNYSRQEFCDSAITSSYYVMRLVGSRRPARGLLTAATDAPLTQNGASLHQ